MRRLTDAREGFTLVEMLIVIVILAIVSAVTVPALRATPDDELTASANALTTLMQRSRQTAVERGQTVSLVVDAENARYWATVMSANNPDSVISYGPIELASGITLSADESRSRYVFGPSGSASGPPIEMRLDSRAAVITLNQWTGDARAEIH
jgi:type IV fimbrial biogenesis protein FimT